jgi:hypothetical protein
MDGCQGLPRERNLISIMNYLAANAKATLTKRFAVESFTREPIGYIENHVMANCLDRWVVNSLPLHCAIHKIDVGESLQEYSLTHSHDAEDELNLIINDQGHDFIYRFVIDDEEFELSAPACIWVPAKITHNANVVRGRGTFVCMRFPENSAGSMQTASK